MVMTTFLRTTGGGGTSFAMEGIGGGRDEHESTSIWKNSESECSHIFISISFVCRR
jgi:hypothetical protein